MLVFQGVHQVFVCPFRAVALAKMPFGLCAKSGCLRKICAAHKKSVWDKAVLSKKEIALHHKNEG